MLARHELNLCCEDHRVELYYEDFRRVTKDAIDQEIERAKDDNPL